MNDIGNELTLARPNTENYEHSWKRKTSRSNLWPLETTKQSEEDTSIWTQPEKKITSHAENRQGEDQRELILGPQNNELLETAKQQNDS